VTGTSGSMAAIDTPGTHRTPILVRLVRITRLVLHLAHGLFIVRLRYSRLSEGERHEVKRLWFGKTLSILSISIREQDAPRDLPERCVLVLNHISWLDIFVIGASHPATFIAKSEIRGWPLVGPLCTGVGTLYIERGKRAEALRARQAIAEAIGRGVLIAFFPEGTTTYGRSLGRFHPALFQPALDVAATLQPVALRYVDVAGMHTDAAAYAGESSFMESVWAIVSTRSIVAEMRLLEPLPTVGQTRRSLAENAEALIAAALGLPAPQEISRSGHQGRAPGTGAGPLDSGCVWGGALSAIRVESDKVRRNAQAERRPVPADYRVVRAFPPRYFEPRKIARWTCFRFAFAAELHYALGGAEAQAGHGVDDNAKALDSVQAVAPTVWTRSVKLRQEFPVPGSA